MVTPVVAVAERERRDERAFGVQRCRRSKCVAQTARSASVIVSAKLSRGGWMK
jgi:hypothetical protein